MQTAPKNAIHRDQNPKAGERRTVIVASLELCEGAVAAS